MFFFFAWSVLNKNPVLCVHRFIRSCMRQTYLLLRYFYCVLYCHFFNSMENLLACNCCGDKTRQVIMEL